ncbi:hypothetical protein [Crossiella equi]|uniref:hypothetical protein n=1 Tax=Crossiella equi TaxID=130796 RepID=UPI00130282C6|nr:hypothetical protein [Crossiella equi]
MNQDAANPIGGRSVGDDLDPKVTLNIELTRQILFHHHCSPPFAHRWHIWQPTTHQE